MMRKRNYINKRRRANRIQQYIQKVISSCVYFLYRNKMRVSLCTMLCLLALIFSFCIIHRQTAEVALANDLTLDDVMDVPLASASSKRVVLSVPKGIVKTDPFVPYRDIDGKSFVNDVPTNILVPPPDSVNGNSDAARVMDTMVSGILYDKFSPSAILNIEGSDYLVKKGDTVNNYKVLDIVQDSVTVCLGANVYKAGIGEILTEGTINENEVSNLNNKFGGKE